ncbi:hypothetical protein HPB52_003536 [Rhipicephalus sanguineus]|uniref:Tick transposon n=1 Tax=Rhipicephalus sanguineus TaxID=34632 RepID=A0A9D4QC74_RHISA|nr:hypothetical protein HPB52_003536 [Rhipicephalus sanguineus]
MVIEQHERNGETIARLKEKAANTTGLLKRVTSRKAGMREEPKQARPILHHQPRHVCCSQPQQHELNNINVIIRRSYKTALGPFKSTSTTRFLQIHDHRQEEDAGRPENRTLERDEDEALPANLQDRKVRVKWFLAHARDASEREDNHNKTAHAAARALTKLAPATDRPFLAKDRMPDYKDITKAYPLARRTLPLSHPRLSTRPTSVCRRKTADHTHILGHCIKHPEEARIRMLPPLLEAAARSYDQGLQLWAIIRSSRRSKGRDPASRQRRAQNCAEYPKTT